MAEIIELPSKGAKTRQEFTALFREYLRRCPITLTHAAYRKAVDSVDILHETLPELLAKADISIERKLTTARAFKSLKRALIGEER